MLERHAGVGEADEIDPQRVIWGLTAFHSETGTEGGFWAVQDIRGIDVERAGAPESYSYYGLHRLENGDHLTIFSPDSFPAQSSNPRPPTSTPRVLWEGTIHLLHQPPFTQHASGFWIHDDQAGVERETWASWFLREYPCRLVRARTDPYIVGIWRIPRDGYTGLVVGPQELEFYSDGSVGSRTVPQPGYSQPPHRLRELLQMMRSGEEEFPAG